MKYIAAALLLLAAMSAQNAPSTNKGRHLDISAIAREANGSVVSIVMSDKKGHPIAQGSGFVISKDGRIVTNYHVIKSGGSAIIKLPDGAFFAVDGVLASDKHRDVAIIKAHGNDFRALTLGDSDRLQVGEEVVAIGSPLSLESTVSNGIVSGVRTDEQEGGKFVQITVPISPGSSGGPLFNMAGEVVGITTSHLVGGENLNFAIPIDDVKSLTLVPRSAEARAFPDEAEDDKPTAVASTQNRPDLKETVEFMGRMVAPDDRKIEAKECIVTMTNTKVYTFALPSSVYLKSTDTYGIEHWGYRWRIVHPPEALARFNLADIDPSSIESYGAFSPEAVAYGDLDNKDGRAFKSAADLTVFQLFTRDRNRSIYAIQWEKDKADSAGHVAGVDVHLAGLFVVFKSKDRAERFVTALTHAVQLCGGRASDFAPTPTSK
jgi:hypothetical protein